MRPGKMRCKRVQGAPTLDCPPHFKPSESEVRFGAQYPEKLATFAKLESALTVLCPLGRFNMGGVFMVMKIALVLFVFLVTLIAGVGGQQADLDLLIRNGRIIDGTGNPSFVSDVGLRDGRVAAIGLLSGRSATRVIDASGLAVAPGFIDIHNHSDDTILEDGDAQSMVRQGVTSMIFGEGGSAAPSAAWKDF